MFLKKNRQSLLAKQSMSPFNLTVFILQNSKLGHLEEVSLLSYGMIDGAFVYSTVALLHTLLGISLPDSVAFSGPKLPCVQVLAHLN